MQWALLLGLLLSAASDTVTAPAAIPREKGSVAASGGADHWTADWTMEPVQEQGKPAVHFTEVGRGRYSPYTQPVRWSLEAVWSADGSFRPLRFEKTFTDESGRTLATERKTFDAGKGTVEFEQKREGKSADLKRFPAPADTLTIEGIGGILRFLPFENWHPFTVHLLTNEPRMYAARIELRGMERIQTQAGEFECYKIELVPEVGVLNLFRSFFPKTYFWFSAKQPHFWVRYEGLENGPGTPKIVMELKTYEPAR